MQKCTVRISKVKNFGLIRKSRPIALAASGQSRSRLHRPGVTKITIAKIIGALRLPLFHFINSRSLELNPYHANLHPSGQYPEYSGVPKTVGRLRICARERNSSRGTQDQRCLGSDAGTETCAA